MKVLMQMILFPIKAVFMLILAIIIVICLMNLFVITQAIPQMISYEEIVAKDPEAQIPALVLGAGVINNETPSKILKLRLDEAYALYEVQPTRKFIMSGDHREDNYNEVAVMKQYLVDRGIPSEQIYLDHVGYSTYESFYRAKKVYGQDKLIVITQGYHLSRALLLAKHFNIEAVGRPAAESSSTRFEREFREVFARVKDISLILGYDAGPVEWNYPIDLSKSGDLTNDKEALAIELKQ